MVSVKKLKEVPACAGMTKVKRRMEMEADISEIFCSVQGEGKYVGVRQVFIRFLNCNMRCVWCDTPDARENTAERFNDGSLQGVLDEAGRLWRNCHSISLTGGEPLMQKDFIRALLPHLKKAGVRSYLETNGILYKELAELIEEIDIVAMDIKLPSSTGCGEYWREHEEFLKIALQKEVFVKSVISLATEKQDIFKAVNLIAGINPEIPFILQPEATGINNGTMEKCLEYQEYCLTRLKDVRAIPQMHKFAGIR